MPPKRTLNEQIDFLKRLRPGAAAWMLGVAPRSLRDWVDAPRGEDGTFDAQTLVAWYLIAKATVPADSLMAGSTSPALERYRTAKASLAELELFERHGVLVNRPAFLSVMSRFMDLLRGSAEAVQREFGPLAYEILLEGHKEAQRGMDLYLESACNAYQIHDADRLGDVCRSCPLARKATGHNPPGNAGTGRSILSGGDAGSTEAAGKKSARSPKKKTTRLGQRTSTPRTGGTPTTS